MNQDNTPNPASFALAHLPSYYYLYGRASPHADEALNALYAKNEPQYQVFDFSSDRSSAGLDKPPHSVEQLLTHGYFAVPKGEPELSILQDRKQTSWLSLDDVLSQIHQRTAIYEQNMLELEWAKCYAFNELARQGWPATPEQYATYNRRLQDLHSDQRAERTTFWKDVSNLRRALPENVQQYLSTYRKLEILDESRGDAP
jgi:hypothetical protein